MQRYSCKCGKSTGFGSMPPPRCDGCPECGTRVGAGENETRKPEPHNFITSKVETDDGDGKLTRCMWCMKTKRQIEKE